MSPSCRSAIVIGLVLFTATTPVAADDWTNQHDGLALIQNFFSHRDNTLTEDHDQPEDVQAATSLLTSSASALSLLSHLKLSGLLNVLIGSASIGEVSREMQVFVSNEALMHELDRIFLRLAKDIKFASAWSVDAAAKLDMSATRSREEVVEGLRHFFKLQDEMNKLTKDKLEATRDKLTNALPAEFGAKYEPVLDQFFKVVGGPLSAKRTSYKAVVSAGDAEFCEELGNTLRASRDQSDSSKDVIAQISKVGDAMPGILHGVVEGEQLNQAVEALTQATKAISAIYTHVDDGHALIATHVGGLASKSLNCNL